MIKYKISLKNSKFWGYQSKSGNAGSITLFVSNIYEKSTDFDDFIRKYIITQLTERICLERAFQKIRLKNRCKNCVPSDLAMLMLLMLEYSKEYFFEDLNNQENNF